MAGKPLPWINDADTNLRYFREQAGLGLKEYAAAVTGEGYTSLQFVRNADEDDIDELAKDIGTKHLED